MGGRHQFWIIARVNGRYRTLAGAGHNYCTDTDAVQVCWRCCSRSSAPKRIAHSSVTNSSTCGETRIGLVEPTPDEGAVCEGHDDTDAIPFPIVSTCPLFRRRLCLPPRAIHSMVSGPSVSTQGSLIPWPPSTCNHGGLYHHRRNRPATAAGIALFFIPENYKPRLSGQRESEGKEDEF